MPLLSASVAASLTLFCALPTPWSYAGPPEGTRETAQAPAGAPAVDTAEVGQKDTRPVVRLKVSNAMRNEDKVFPQVVEGRLITDLEDMETFRTVPAEHAGDYLLSCSIFALNLEQGTSMENPRDADSDGQLKTKETLTATMAIMLRLEDASGRVVLEQKISVDATRELEISAQQTVATMTQELIDRAAQKIEKLLRKKLPRPR